MCLPANQETGHNDDGTIIINACRHEGKLPIVPKRFYGATMLPEITLIAGTSVDWTRFVSTVNTILGRSPTRGLDDCGLPVGNPGSYVAALAEFARPGSNPVTAVKEAERLYAHLTFTFLVAVDRETAMLVLKSSAGLIVTSAEPSRGRENLIVTGNLRDWKLAVVEGRRRQRCPRSARSTTSCGRSSIVLGSVTSLHTTRERS